MQRLFGQLTGGDSAVVRYRDSLTPDDAHRRHAHPYCGSGGYEPPSPLAIPQKVTSLFIHMLVCAYLEFMKLITQIDLN